MSALRPWTIDQLKYAAEVCFPADFLRLMTRHGHGPTAASDASYHLVQVKQKGLLAWVFSHSRADFDRPDFGGVIDAMLADLIGDYGQEQTERQSGDAELDSLRAVIRLEWGGYSPRRRLEFLGSAEVTAAIAARGAAESFDLVTVENMDMDVSPDEWEAAYAMFGFDGVAGPARLSANIVNAYRSDLLGLGYAAPTERPARLEVQR